MRIMAVDPGGTTGVAMWSGDFGGLRRSSDLGVRGVRETHELVADPAGGWCSEYMVARDLAEMVVRGCVDVCIVEEFVLAGGKQHSSDPEGLSPVRIGYMFAAVLEERDISVPLVWQTASSALSVVTDKRLRSWGLWEVGSAHVRDAWRHIALWVRKEQERLYV